MAFTYKFLRDWVMFILRDIGDLITETEVTALIAEGTREIQFALDIPDAVKTVEITYPTSRAIPSDCGYIKALSTEDIPAGSTQSECYFDVIDHTDGGIVKKYTDASKGYAYIEGREIFLSWLQPGDSDTLTLKIYYQPIFTSETVDTKNKLGEETNDLYSIQFMKALRYYIMSELLDAHGRTKEHAFKQQRWEAKYMRIVGRSQRYKHTMEPRSHHKPRDF